MLENRKSKVAYIVVGWNNKRLLKQCFDSINKQLYSEKKIIYVDNASSDGSVEWVQKNYPEIKTIPQSKNTGFAKGNNIGIKEALQDLRVEYMALINTDATMDEHWTSRIVEFAKNKTKGACYQGTTLDFYNRNIIDSTHIYLSRNGQGTQGSWRYYLLTDIGPRKIFGVNAAACIINRKFIESQPLYPKVFDERLYMYLEDIDLAIRSTIMGWDNYLVPRARAYHMGSVSSKTRSSSFSLYMTFRNNSAVIFKNLCFKEVIKMLPAIIRGDIDTWRTLWRRHQRSSIWYVIKGRVVGLFRLPLFARKRAIILRRRTVDHDYLWSLMKEGL